MAVYRQRIEAALRPLLDRGYAVVDAMEAPKSFGDARLVVASGRLRLRFTSDRGQLFVDVGDPGSGSWYDLSELLTRAGIRVSPGPWDTADAAVRDLDQYEALITSKIADPNFTANLAARR